MKRLNRQQLELASNALAHMHDSHWKEICDIKARAEKGEFTQVDADLVPALFYEARDCLETILVIQSLDSRSNLIRQIAERAKKRLAQIKKSGEALDSIIAISK